MVMKIISGGQTGADQAGLAVAKRPGIPTEHVPGGQDLLEHAAHDLGVTMVDHVAAWVRCGHACFL
jgi:hypothetical protein